MYTQGINLLLSLLPTVEDYDWTTNRREEIRGDGGVCPICAIVNEGDQSKAGVAWVLDGWHAVQSDPRLNEAVTLDDVAAFMMAADTTYGYDKTLRGRIADALSLVEAP